MTAPKHPSAREVLERRTAAAAPVPAAAVSTTETHVVGDRIAHVRFMPEPVSLGVAHDADELRRVLARENMRARIYQRSCELCTAFVFTSRWFQGSPLEARVDAAVAWVRFNDELVRVGLSRL